MLWVGTQCKDWQFQCHVRQISVIDKHWLGSSYLYIHRARWGGIFVPPQGEWMPLLQHTFSSDSGNYRLNEYFESCYTSLSSNDLWSLEAIPDCAVNTTKVVDCCPHSRGWHADITLKITQTKLEQLPFSILRREYPTLTHEALGRETWVWPCRLLNTNIDGYFTAATVRNLLHLQYFQW